MTSKLELNDLGKTHLVNQLIKHYFACTFVKSEFYDKANKNIANDKLYLDLKAAETTHLQGCRIEFTKDHVKFKEEV